MGGFLTSHPCHTEYLLWLCDVSHTLFSPCTISFHQVSFTFANVNFPLKGRRTKCMIYLVDKGKRGWGRKVQMKYIWAPLGLH
ncbi:hypothetical protein GDO86_003007 [Hymenochirus boettgeri]|uniref:Uncharacterized protein n=1 Tax=Hymenochirus boettgeri TaxID=247094 RepID=A0A8T2K7G3_9PIPI|nr:hypothetical protein GDO86_003007 [Hymenochirus boettgeri]